ncbi:hypothetical protein GCM10019016_112010 [Streptomyces prasinosporus]|uniref:Uncharacterized protein n=1 Tax=Streptomyces prasinosporus TaxID=68256 RepID=A0ABP6UBL2_9ACTN|nr:hypothetical protein GCM10010332_23990 [Streptomyces albogriseolus]
MCGAVAWRRGWVTTERCTITATRHLGGSGGAAGELASVFDPASPFGFRFTMTGVPFGSDVSGYLDGAALALDSYAEDGTPADWDMPLLPAQVYCPSG